MVELVREDPPHMGAGKGSWIERLLPIMDHPGEWFRIATAPQKKGGESTAYALRSGRLRTPPGRWEFTSAWVPEANESRAYARYLGDPSDPVEATIDPRTQAPISREPIDYLDRVEITSAAIPVETPVHDAAEAAATADDDVTPSTTPMEGANPPVFSFSGGDPAPVE